MATTDRQMLLICMGLAFVFWLILNLSQEYEINKDVNITYTVGPERVVAGTPPQSVPVQLSGRGWDLIWESARGRSIDVSIDLADQRELLLSSNLLQQEISRQLSSGDLEVVSMGFESVQLLTTPREGKRVPVMPDVTASYVAGYFSPEQPTVRPDSVTVNGAADALQEIFSWPTEPLFLERLEQNTVATVALQPPPPGLTLNYSDVQVGLSVEAFIEQQLSVPIALEHAPAGDSVRVYPNHVTITLTIPESEFGKYSMTDFHVEADLLQMSTAGEDNTLPLTLTRVPEAIKSVTFFPRAVEYYVYRIDN
ncbi:hypothetical protein LEM8419_01545 [Neolewinella maritima]|uniref:YbbR-like domain-containing protein n=1 Tax=Neolewinella maritima TaxID=1383882 RepID=A0ABM9B0G1_9BACT|nr:hypothetical protein [Neolewinella maritima]CAH1000392.1 hypothetical protein LEM8419_01545 [Neolewinella maritima]